MPAPLRVVGLVPGWIALLGLGWSATAGAGSAAGRDLRPGASTAEGDPDFREVIFLSVPDEPRTGSICGCSTRTRRRARPGLRGGGRYPDTLHAIGGEGAYTGAAGTGVAPDAEQLAAGTLLGQQVVAASAALDDRWQTLFSIAPDQGEAVGGRRFPPAGRGRGRRRRQSVRSDPEPARSPQSGAARNSRSSISRRPRGSPTRRGSPSCASACRRMPRR